MDAPVRAALLGYGLGGRYFHAPFLRVVPGFDLRAVVTADAERAAQAAAETGAEVVASADEVWERSAEFDLVVISTANIAHVPQAEEALRRGLHVVVDKPLCADAATARHLATRAEVADRLLVTYQNRRWDGEFRTLRELVASGALGQVHRFETRFERWRPVPKGGWRELGEPAEMGGLLYDLGVHTIDQALLLLGPAESVYAEVAARRAGETVDDDTFVAVHHRGGAVSHHWLSVLAASGGPRYRVLGSSGAYVMTDLDTQEDALRADLAALPEWGSDQPWGGRPAEADGVLRTDEGALAVPTLPGDYRLFWVQLLAALTEGAPSPVPLDETIALMAVIDAARASGRSGQVEPVVVPG